MAVVYLVRHGQASFGSADYDVLSERGQEQSRVLGHELARRGLRPDRVLTGTMKRQQDTARYALKVAGLPPDVEVDGRFDEYDHLALLSHHLPENRASLFAGATTAGRARTVQRALDDALGRWIEAGGCAECERPWPRFDAGVSAALDGLLEDLGSGGVGLVVTSGGVVAATVRRLLGLSAEGFVAVNRVVANASLTKVVHGRSGTSLLSFNDHGHFEGEARDLLTYR
jgi:broad specificity phosphatase PhoE